MHIIVDGYNLIRQSDALRQYERISLEEGRRALVRSLADYRKLRGHRITVVFDGWEGGSPQEERDLRRRGGDHLFPPRGEGRRGDQTDGRGRGARRSWSSPPTGRSPSLPPAAGRPPSPRSLSPRGSTGSPPRRRRMPIPRRRRRGRGRSPRRREKEGPRPAPLQTETGRPRPDQETLKRDECDGDVTGPDRPSGHYRRPKAHSPSRKGQSSPIPSQIRGARASGHAAYSVQREER